MWVTNDVPENAGPTAYIMKKTMDKQQHSLGRLLGFARQCAGLLSASVALAAAGVACGMIPYIAVSVMLSRLYQGGASAQDMILWAAIAFGGHAGSVGSGTLSTMLSHKAAFTILKTIREDMAAKMARMPLGYVLRLPSGKVKTLLVDTVEKMEAPLAHLIPELSSNLLIPLGMACYLFILDWRMALAAIATFPVGLLCYLGMTRDYAERYGKVQLASKNMNAAVVEYINGIEVIKAFNQSASSYEKFVSAVKANQDELSGWFCSCSGYFTLGIAIAPASLLFVLPCAAFLHGNGSLDAPTAATCVILSLGLLPPLIRALEYTDNLAMVDGTVRELCSMLDEPELERPELPASLEDRSVVFDRVSFGYTSEEVLRDVSFSLVEGGVTALIGPSGSGKSTIAKLLAGFWDVSKGQILLGRVDIRRLPLSQAMEHIAYVSQDTFLFDMSLMDNIRIGKPGATDEEVVAAAKAAACHDFIMALPGGYNNPAGDAGRRLSGGERQRVTIARAILKDSPIIILDEATAFTDPENEAYIQDSINSLVQGKTLLVIAHRLSTIVRADRIIVLREGAIEAQGTHPELLSGCALYRQLWEAHTDTKERPGGEESHG
jgi:ATP-binding cassette subfamily B protein